MSSEYIAAELGVFGLAVGSFLNVVIDRLPRGQSIVSIPSHCAVCHTQLGILDLVPVLSYLWLRRRCRYCRTKISVKLPLVELFTGLVFAYVGYEYGLSLSTALLLVYGGFLIVVFMVDLEHGLILNRVIFPAIIVALGFSSLRPETISDGPLEVFWRSMLGGGIAFVLMLVIYLLARGGMGAGDVKLGAFLGLITGYPVAMMALLMAFVGGGVVAAFLLVSKIKGRKQSIPFGPFLSLSALVSLLWGDSIYDRYFNLF